MKPLPEPGSQVPVFARKVPRGFTAEPRSISQRPPQIPRPPNPGPRLRATGEGRGCVFFCEGRLSVRRLPLFEHAPAVVPRPEFAPPHRVSRMPAGGRKPAGDCFAPAARGRGAGAGGRRMSRRDGYGNRPSALPRSLPSPFPFSLNPAVTEGGCQRSLLAPSDLRPQDNFAAWADAAIGIYLIAASAPGAGPFPARKLQVSILP